MNNKLGNIFWLDKMKKKRFYVGFGSRYLTKWIQIKLKRIPTLLFRLAFDFYMPFVLIIKILIVYNTGVYIVPLILKPSHARFEKASQHCNGKNHFFMLSSSFFCPPYLYFLFSFYPSFSSLLSSSFEKL